MKAKPWQRQRENWGPLMKFLVTSITELEKELKWKLKDNFLVKKKTPGATGEQGREREKPLSRKSDMIDDRGMRWRGRT